MDELKSTTPVVCPLNDAVSVQKAHGPAPRWSRRLITTALIAFALAVPLAFLTRKFIFAGPAAIALFLLSLVLGAAGMIVHLFGVAQMRLIECLMVTAFLGNAFGIAYRFVDEFLRQITHNERLAVFAVVCVALLSCVIGGASNGLEIIRKTGARTQRRRLWILAVTIMCPCGILALPGAAIAFVKYRDALLFPLGAYLLLLAVANLFILRRDLSVHEAA